MIADCVVWLNWYLYASGLLLVQKHYTMFSINARTLQSKYLLNSSLSNDHGAQNRVGGQRSAD